uniref:Uncharacterized protein n=1 Tax=Oryza meridionalis TaxID=40149 RepID=A0A0E0F1U6_9ORYZ
MSADLTPSEELRHIYDPDANDLGIPSSLHISIPSPSSEAPREIVHGNGMLSHIISRTTLWRPGVYVEAGGGVTSTLAYKGGWT